MASSAFRKLMALDLEEKILNLGSAISFVCIFFPWVSGEWLGGKNVTYSGLGFFTSFIGLSILLLQAYVLLITLVPVTGGPIIIKRQNKHGVRLFVTLLASVLTVAAWSVLTKFTFEFRLQISFGLYGTLIGSLVATLYAFLLFQEHRRGVVKEFFHHGDGKQHKEPQPGSPPPPANEPEDHRMYS